MEHDCPYCDGWPGSKKTYANQAVMPLGDNLAGIDFCIHHIVAALNVSNIKTTMCCCGHKRFPGHIVLADGRELVIFDSEELHKRDEQLYGLDDSTGNIHSLWTSLVSLHQRQQVDRNQKNQEILDSLVQGGNKGCE